jgi:hypothetical protein
MNLISCGPLGHVSDIKLIRTDTTLDLSQKAEKGMFSVVVSLLLYTQCLASGCSYSIDVGLNVLSRFEFDKPSGGASLRLCP